MPSRTEALRRYGALARAVLRARRGAFDPFKLTWIVTEQCSLHCRTCHLWATDPDGGPDLATVADIVAANRQLTWLNLSGGDLVERPDAPELLQTVVRGMPDLALLDFPTAGQDVDRTVAALQPLLDSDVPRLYVTVSLDGPDHVHDRVRGGRGAAARARATYDRLRAIRRPGFRVVAGMTLSRHNLPEQPPAPVHSVLPDGIAPADLHVNLAHHSGHYYRNGPDDAPPVDSALAVLAYVARARGGWLSPLAWMERRYAALARRYLRTGDVGGHCGALRASVFLGADGRVFPCTIFDRPLGHLGDVGWSLRRIPELATSGPALDDVERRRCPGCWSPCEAFPTLLVGLGRPL